MREGSLGMSLLCAYPKHQGSETPTHNLRMSNKKKREVQIVHLSTITSHVMSPLYADRHEITNLDVDIEYLPPTLFRRNSFNICRREVGLCLGQSEARMVISIDRSAR